MVSVTHSMGSRMFFSLLQGLRPLGASAIANAHPGRGLTPAYYLAPSPRAYNSAGVLARF